LAFWSAFFWFAWEAVNLRLHNWHYIGVSSEIWLRWLGAWVAFATVLPGVLTTYELLESLGVRWGSRVRPLAAGESWRGPCLAAGLTMMALPLIWPQLFFPLVWLALIFILEPVNHRLGLPSLARYWQQGDLSPLVRLLLAGAATGFIWESLNFLSDVRWTYSIPYLNEPKIFAMPLAGYGGFLPFAVECFVFTSFISLLRGGAGWRAADHLLATRAHPLPGLVVLITLAAVGFNFFMLLMIDRHLVIGWA
jgi:hypothetical protein